MKIGSKTWSQLSKSLMPHVQQYRQNKNPSELLPTEVECEAQKTPTGRNISLYLMRSRYASGNMHPMQGTGFDGWGKEGNVEDIQDILKYGRAQRCDTACPESCQGIGNSEHRLRNKDCQERK